MPKKFGSVFVIMGAVLMLSALLLFLYNGYVDYRAGQEAELLLNDIQSIIVEGTLSAKAPENSETNLLEVEPVEAENELETLPAELPTLEINGYDYIGFLSIPDLELELPVMAEWDYTRLRIAPCRHFGSSRTDDLVIAAHNYKTHFASLSNLEIGAEVTFTDMDGIINRYTLAKSPERLSPDAVEAVQNSKFDLVLYTCTPGGSSRVVVFCDRITEETTGDAHG